MHVYHHLLGVGPEASDAEIRKHYMEKVKEHPPESSPLAFQRLTRAYEGLKDRRARARTFYEGFSDVQDLEEGLAWLLGDKKVERRGPTLAELLRVEGVGDK